LAANVKPELNDMYAVKTLRTVCTGFHLLVVFIWRGLPLHDNDESNSFWRTRLAQWNFLAQHGSQLGH